MTLHNVAADEIIHLGGQEATRMSERLIGSHSSLTQDTCGNEYQAAYSRAPMLTHEAQFNDAVLNWIESVT